MCVLARGLPWDIPFHTLITGEFSVVLCVQETEKGETVQQMGHLAMQLAQAQQQLRQQVNLVTV